MSARRTATVLSSTELGDEIPLVIVQGHAPRHVVVHLEGQSHVFRAAALTAALEYVIEGGGDDGR